MKLSPAEIEDFRAQLSASARPAAPTHPCPARRGSKRRFPVLTDEYIAAIEERWVVPQVADPIESAPSAARSCGFGGPRSHAIQNFARYTRERIFG